MQRLRFASASLGAVLIIGAPAGWFLSQPPSSVGELPPTTSVSESVPSEDPPSPEASAPPAALDDRDPPAAEPAPEPPPPPAPPRQLRIPSLGVDAPVVDVGLEEDGGMEIPEDVSTVGWYELGVAPGAPSGTAVISGHVDSHIQGRGALWDLRTMDVDDLIEVEHEDGSVSEWRVVARRSYPKEELPIPDIFTRFGEPQLVLITCDGEFDRSQRRYADNVVVYTVPANA